MATTLHEQLKQHYVRCSDRHEILLDGFRIDAIDGRRRLVEIQCASLSSIRSKIRHLLRSHRVIVVKPLASYKLIIRQSARDGPVLSSRTSPLHQGLFHVFQDLVHFVDVFPHPRLRLDVLLTHQEEVRIPPTGRSSWKKNYRVDDRRLICVEQQTRLSTPHELWASLNLTVGAEFTTVELAESAGMPLWLARKAAYCFRLMNYFDVCGRRGRLVVYRLSDGQRRGRAA